MNLKQEIVWLDYCGKGKKSRAGGHYSKSEKVTITEPSNKAMLHTAARKPQAILKITAYGKGRLRVSNHLSYISRNATLALENDRGDKITTREEQSNVLDGWEVDFGGIARSRDTLHLMLSSPSGSNPTRMEQAARQFLSKEFAAEGHEYLFVLHQDTHHPHVHCVIKMTSVHDKKLNPRKEYLRELRKSFADICLEHGMSVEASSRYDRGLLGKSNNSKMLHMKRRGKLPEKDEQLIAKVMQERKPGVKISLHPSALKIQQRNFIIRKRYADRAKQVADEAKVLMNTDERKQHQESARLLEQFANELQTGVSRGQKLHRHLDVKFVKRASRLKGADLEMG